MTSSHGSALSRRHFALGGGVAALLTGACQTGASFEPFDLAILGARVMDPESGHDDVAHIGVRNGQVATVTRQTISARTVIDGRGLVAAPGFIDLHAHGQTLGDGDIQARDGVTTALELESGVFPIAPFYKRREGRSRIHFGASAGHRGARILLTTGIEAGHSLTEPETQVRIQMRVQDWAYAHLKTDELKKLRALLTEGFMAGGLGIGLAPEYIPGADREEVLQVFEEAAALKAPVFVHVRRTASALGDAPMEPIQEMLANAAATGAALHLCHINSKALGMIDPALRLINGARARGIDVSSEVYPYTAGSTLIGSALFDEGWRQRLGADYRDIEWPLTGERLTEESFTRYRREQPEGWAIIHNITDETVDRAIADPDVIIASDGAPFIRGSGHPRGAGTYARVLGRYVRERKLLSLMDGIRKMTLLPARRLETISPTMRRKGRLQPGADADIVLFDPARVIDRATFEKPTTPSEGIPYVIVGGQVIVDEGQIVGSAFPGQGVRAHV